MHFSIVSSVKIAKIYEMSKEENKYGVFGSTGEETCALIKANWQLSAQNGDRVMPPFSS